MANKITLTANDGSIVEFYDEIKAQGGVKDVYLVLTKPMLSLSIASQSMLMTDERIDQYCWISIASRIFRYSRGELLEKSVCMAYKNG